MEQDWDNLIILDACRFDLFEEVSKFDGDLNSVISQGSSTAEFLRGNFADNSYYDTVYVSANPQLERHDMVENFYACKRLWENHWDPDLHTVMPSDVTDSAIETIEKHPNKRLIIHYVQPHFPFIGELGREITHSGFAETPGELDETDAPTVWEQLESGNLSGSLVWNAYRENLECTLPEVQRLLNSIDGKSIVTADHGNAFGEMGVYGHPGNHYIDALVRVPWQIVSGKERRSITSASEKLDNYRKEDSTVQDRLADLGYKS